MGNRPTYVTTVTITNFRQPGKRPSRFYTDFVRELLIDTAGIEDVRVAGIGLIGLVTGPLNARQQQHMQEFVSDVFTRVDHANFNAEIEDQIQGPAPVLSFSKPELTQ